MTGTLDGKTLAPAPESGAGAAQLATAHAPMPHRSWLSVTLPGEIAITKDGQVHATLVLDGEIDEETHPVLIEALSLLPRDNTSLHVDLSAVTFCDLAGLRALIRLAGPIAQVTLQGVPPPLRTVMRILGWDQEPGLVISTCEHAAPG
jgi:anti-anti-sigma regulatory factor